MNNNKQTSQALEWSMYSSKKSKPYFDHEKLYFLIYI